MNTSENQNFDIAIISGYGSLPVELAEGAQRLGRCPFMIGIAGEAGEEILPYPHEFLAWGQLGRLFQLLKSHGIREVVLAGGIRKRPDLTKLKLDLGAILSLPQALAFMLGGDNTVLSGAIKLFEKRGIAVIGAHQLLPHLLAPKGLISGRKPGERDIACMRLGFSVCKALGKFDIGQAAIAEAQRVVAVEGAEGTDAMLERVVQMRVDGRMPADGKNGVLVKTLKPGQDVRADLPAIGPTTISGVKRAGLKGIALEAGKTLILERENTIGEARRLGIYIFGLSDSEGG